MRDDWLGWFDGDGKGGDDKEKGFEQLPSYMLKVRFGVVLGQASPLSLKGECAWGGGAGADAGVGAEAAHTRARHDKL